MISALRLRADINSIERKERVEICEPSAELNPSLIELLCYTVLISPTYSSSGQSQEQESIFWHQPREGIRRFHLCAHPAAPRRDKLHWIKLGMFQVCRDAWSINFLLQVRYNTNAFVPIPEYVQELALDYAAFQFHDFIDLVLNPHEYYTKTVPPVSVTLTPWHMPYCMVH